MYSSSPCLVLHYHTDFRHIAGRNIKLTKYMWLVAQRGRRHDVAGSGRPGDPSSPYIRSMSRAVNADVYRGDPFWSETDASDVQPFLA